MQTSVDDVFKCGISLADVKRPGLAYNIHYTVYNFTLSN
jgi:hypothetical protein